MLCLVERRSQAKFIDGVMGSSRCIVGIGSGKQIVFAAQGDSAQSRSAALLSVSTGGHQKVEQEAVSETLRFAPKSSLPRVQYR